MRGKDKGVGPRIQREYPKAVPVWCSSHKLNLVVVSGLKLLPVDNMMCTMDSIVRFFDNSPKREETLIRHIENLTSRGARDKIKLKELCKTRWVERHDALQVFAELYTPVFRTLEEISTNPANFNPKTVADASALALSMSQFQFLVSLHITKETLGHLSILSKSLQGKGQDIIRAFKHVQIAKKALQDSRGNVEIFHTKCFDTAKKVAEELGIQEAMARVTGRQTLRGNAPAVSPREYFKRNVTIPLLYQLVTEVSERFGDLQLRALKAMKLVPSVIADSAWVETESLVKELDKEYHDDLPAHIGFGG